MRYRWIDPTEMPKPRGPVPMPRAKARKKTIGRALRDPRRTRSEADGAEVAIEDPAASVVPGDVPLMEWHHLPPAEREAEWRALVEWVEWLHDRYELGISNRLPDCWPHHPGLIEELRALKAWREQIYTSAAPSGQAGRAWHNELRGLAEAMRTFYANGCRARPEHRLPQSLRGSAPQARHQWLNADHNIGIPPRLLTGSWGATNSTEGDDVISHDDMQRHLDNGTAALLDGAAEYVHHADAWWAATSDGWLKITDRAVASELDNAQTRLAALAEASAVQKRLNDL